MIISQIFLQLYPDKTINDFPIFIKSKTAYEKLGTYQLIGDKEADLLMIQYPEFYEMWKEVKYSIMKVDILRFIILYHYGGLVSDLDIIPLKTEYKMEDTILIYSPNVLFNYEVIISKPKQEIFLSFLRYVKEQIQIKNELPIYKVWKARYVFQTSGPHSFKRFIKKHKDKFKIVEKINRLNKRGDENGWEENDFVSLQCSSWLNSMGVKQTNRIKYTLQNEILNNKDKPL